MRNRTRVYGLLLAALAAGCAGRDRPVPMVKAGDYRISGPYTHSNLDVFLIHGKDRMPTGNILTLEEALASGDFVVHETSNVQKLQVENKSAESYIYLQAGEMLKGGKQDRTLQEDHIVPPESGKMPIASFCVEQGRWGKRDRDPENWFRHGGHSHSHRMLHAIRLKASQGAVWDEVANVQTMITKGTGESVRSETSPTSLHLSLKHRKLKEMIEPYKKALSGVADGKPDTIGFAVAVNGKILGADVYGSHKLFAKLWPGMLTAAIQEAFAERHRSPEARVVGAFMLAVQKGKETGKKLPGGSRTVRRESEAGVLFKLLLREQKASGVHEGYISK